MNVRPAGPADLPAIAAIFRDAAERTNATFATRGDDDAVWAERFAKSRARYPWLVAEGEGRVIGFAKAGPFRERDAYAWTVETSVFIAPGHHRRGAGRALMTRLIEILRAQGYQTAVAVVTADNVPALRLHESLGMRAAGNLERAGFKLGRWHAIAFLTLRLQPGGAAPGPIRPVDAAIADDAPR